MENLVLLLLSAHLGLPILLLCLFAIDRQNIRPPLKLRLSYLVIGTFGATILIVNGLPYKNYSDNPFRNLVQLERQDSLGADGKWSAKLGLKTKLSSQRATLTDEDILEIKSLGLTLLLVIGFVFIMRWIFQLWCLQVLRSKAHVVRSIGKVKIYVSEGIVSPFAFSFTNAEVFLPIKMLFDAKDLKMTLAHEIQHHRQGDTKIIFVLEFLKLVLFPNPLAKVAIGKVVEFQEQACDYAVLNKRGFSWEDYSLCLLRVASGLSHIPFGAVGMAANFQQLKRRISIMKEVTKSKAPPKLIATLLVLGFSLPVMAWSIRGAVNDRRISIEQARQLAKKVSAEQDIPVQVDNTVLYWLNKGVGSEKGRVFLKASLQRMEKYRPMIERKLSAAGLPLELIAVPLVESGYNNSAISYLKAKGIWQFIAGTAKSCGLTVNAKIDERDDPEKLTDAAVCYYSRLYAIFQNWHVAISAYNVGEKKMFREISKASHNDALKLAEKGALGREGKYYLPKVLAAMIILKNPQLLDL